MHDLRFFHTDLGLRIAETFSRQLENRAATSSNLYLVANLAPVVHDPKRARSPTPEDHATRGSQRSRIALLASQFTLAANHAPRAVRLMTVEFVRTSVYFCGTTRYCTHTTAVTHNTRDDGMLMRARTCPPSNPPGLARFSAHAISALH